MKIFQSNLLVVLHEFSHLEDIVLTLHIVHWKQNFVLQYLKQDLVLEFLVVHQ